MSNASAPIDYAARLAEALLALQKLRGRLEAVERARSEPIAVIGLGCRFPGQANDPESFWQLLCNGVDAIREVPPDRWDVDAYYDPDPDVPGKMYSRWGGFLDRVDGFDPLFFGISPREARSMDPQQRLLLEVAWEALEHAGQSPDKLSGSRTGIFVGVTANDYVQLQSRLGDFDSIDAYRLTGGALNATAGRVSFALGLQGPCVALDTACSSSLVAVHLACQSLRSGESDMVLAGGVNLILSPESTISACKNKMLSPDGRCKTFDASANGFVRGEGCGLVVLKRLSDALANTDMILALIRGSAINQDGPSSGFTVPNKQAQSAVIQAALSAAGIEPAQVGYVEAHGTGTSLGDPIEVRALSAALGAGRSTDRPLILGSVKTNMGHLESASGIAGLIKAVLSVQHGEIPPHLHFHEPNAYIPWNEMPMVIPTRQTPWPAGYDRRVAGVSSFGASGVNAHVIVEQAPEAAPVIPSESESNRAYLLPISARSPAALRDLAQSYATFLTSTKPDAQDVGYTASLRRAHHDYRLAVVGQSSAELAERLIGDRPIAASPSSPSKIAFVFTGQGAQWWAMGRELLDQEPVFRETIEHCNELFKAHASWSLLTELTKSEAESCLDQTEIAQPAIFALQIALAALWRSWGITPDAVVGHSVGEIAAAHLAGVLNLEDAVRVAFHRGRLMQRATGLGQMAAIELSAAEVEQAIAGHEDRLSIAAINSPTSVTLSGEASALEEVVASLQQRGILCRMLHVNYAFHSPQMEPFKAELVEALRGLEPKPIVTPLVSTVTGELATARDYDAAYWGRNLRQSVRFAAAIDHLIEAGFTTFVEIGPHPALLPSIKQTFGSRGQEGRLLASLRRGQAERVTLLNSLGALYTAGHKIDWKGLYPTDHRIVSLPAYPWQRERYWIEMRRDITARRQKRSVHPLLGQRLHSPALKDVVFEATLTVEDLPFLADHQILGIIIAPATAYIEMVCAAATQVLGDGLCTIENMVIQAALVIDDAHAPTVQVILSNVEVDSASFEIMSSAGESDKWILHATGTVQRGALQANGSLADARLRCRDEVPTSVFYQQLRTLGIEFGPRFQSMTQLWRHASSGEAVAHIIAADGITSELADYHCHPALLDACLQAINVILLSDDDQGETLYLPIGFDRLHIYSPLGSEIWSHAVVRSDVDGHKEILSGDVRLFDVAGQLIAEVGGLRLKRATRTALQSRPVDFEDWLYQIHWQSAPLNFQPAALTGAWLLLADKSGVAAELAQQMQAGGAECMLVEPDDERTLLILQERNDWRGIIYLGALDSAHSNDGSGRSVLHLVQMLAQVNQPPRLWLITRRTQSVRSGEAPDVDHAPLWGLAATIALEQPEMRCTCLDLDPSTSAHRDAQTLIMEMASNDGEDRVAYRGGDRFVARLARYVPRTASDTSSPVQLTIPARGLLDNLVLQPVTRRAPARGEVEIRVRATGLNFRDVLNALGMYPGEAGPLGGECAGGIVAVGEGVDQLHIGDEVMALALGSFSTYTITRAEFVTPKPSGLSFEAAATLPIAFLTAQYGLHHLAQLKRGDRVLIHAAAGGVGLAAVQIAQRAGAEIFGTASPEKQAYLRSIGVQHVLNSRTLDFADEIRHLTNGEGVDIVLNSLSGEFIAKSVSVLRPQGCFLEIGKRDIWSAEKIAQLQPGVAYHVYDLGEVMRESPTLIQSLFHDLVQSIEHGDLKPLPQRVFALNEAAEAFRFMERAKHIGKIVVTQPPDRSSRPIAIRPDGTYLITGGLGGLGLHMARWLVDQGAQHVILIGRHEPSEAAQAVIDELAQQGVHISVAQVDVSQADQLAAVLSGIDPTAQLRGILHAAGIVDDGVLTQQTWERFSAVAAPKALGAWQLHALTQARGDSLDFFLLFSSAASVLGSVGQANYAAANAYLDALAHLRQAQGLPALSINWGPWSEVGMFAALSEHDRQRRLAQGMQSISAAQGGQVMTYLLQQAAVQVIVLPIDWRQYGTSTPLLAEIARGLKPIEKKQPVSPAADVLARLQAVSPNQRRAALLTHAREQAIKVLGLTSSHIIDPGQPLREMGLDSLMAVELRNALGASLKCSLPATLLFDYPTLEALVDFLAKELWPVETPPVRSSAEEAQAPSAGAADLIDLSEEQAEALLLQELAASKRGLRNG